ncbi:cyclic nucleotide-binding domain-containing protein [Oleiharenicola lentus]|uniref:cyclic nucleotide-binding domain-containing protein n=1 Tax=Oleiharenicola lentus TaxID=2508720 RepID=UPI003F67D4B9
METNLKLTANRWQLATQLQRTPVFGGVLWLKNIPEATYLKVTRKQWAILERFIEPRTVPALLQEIIEDRTCPALGEFYELMLKAIEARILIEPRQTPSPNPVVNWPVSVRPVMVGSLLWAIFLVSCAFVLWRPPAIPNTVEAVAIGLGVLVVKAFVGAALAATLLRGAGGEVYVSRKIFVNLKDACMISPADYRRVAVAPLAILALTTALLSWYRSSWGFLPMLGLLFHLRPIFSGVINRMMRVSFGKRLSDAEHDYIFPPNKTARMRVKLLLRSLRNSSTWLQVGYGVGWIIAVTYLIGASTEVPPWKPVFWEEHGPTIGLAVVASLALLGAIYLCGEFYLFARERAFARRDTMRQWWARWFGKARFANDEAERLRAVVRSPLLRLLSPPSQAMLAHALTPVSARAWKTLQSFDDPTVNVSLIRSGKVGVYRRLASGRRELSHVLCENDIVGLHAVADPKNPVFLYRTLTPVVLLQVSWDQAKDMILSPLGPIDIANPVQKLPFLSRISLCQNWHVQAIQRFSELSRLLDYREGETILNQGYYSESFFIIFEGEARIMSTKGRQVGTIRAGNFFGEIGLLQNSNTTAQVVAGKGTRCLCIPRQEFLRFVAHNYTVALTLERVSSKRLGHPIFPMVPGNFQQL